MTQSGEYTGLTPLIFWKAKSSSHSKIPQLKAPEQFTGTESLQGPIYSVASLPQSRASEEVLNHKSPSLLLWAPSLLSVRQAPLAPASSASRLPSTQAASFGCLQRPRQPRRGSRAEIPSPAFFYLKETSSLVQTAGAHGPNWHFPQRGSTARQGLLKVETFSMVSPACRKFLSKPQNTHNNIPAKIFFRQQHCAIYFPPKPLHLLSARFPAAASTLPRLCPTSLPHPLCQQLTSKVLRTPGSIMMALCVCLTPCWSPKGTNISCPHNLLWKLIDFIWQITEEWSSLCPRKSCC